MASNERAMDPAHSLALAFDTGDPEFARGVEIGRLWEQVKRCPRSFTQDVHASNTEMVMRIAEAVGREVRGETIDDSWLRVTFGVAEEQDAP
jgi:hypothetical protein